MSRTRGGLTVWWMGGEGALEEGELRGWPASASGGTVSRPSRPRVLGGGGRKRGSPALAWWGRGTQKSCPDTSPSGSRSRLHVVSSHLVHLELDLCHVRCHLRVVERASLGEQMLSESSLPQRPRRAQGPRREGNGSEEGSRFSVGAKRFLALRSHTPDQTLCSSGRAWVLCSWSSFFSNPLHLPSWGPEPQPGTPGDGGRWPGSRGRSPRRWHRSVACLAHHAGWWWEVQAGPQSWTGTFVAWAVLSTDAGPCQAAATSCS